MPGPLQYRSTAALCTHDLREVLAGRGIDCRVLTTAIFDPERETSLDEVFATLELPSQRFQAELGLGRAAEEYCFTCPRIPAVTQARSGS